MIGDRIAVRRIEFMAFTADSLVNEAALVIWVSQREINA